MAWRTRARAAVQPTLGAAMLVWETTQHQVDRPVLLGIALYLMVGRPALGLLDRLLGTGQDTSGGPSEPEQPGTPPGPPGTSPS